MMAASQSVYLRLFSGKELSARHSKLPFAFRGASSRVILRKVYQLVATAVYKPKHNHNHGRPSTQNIPLPNRRYSRR
jgi:hypothetical protein